jgi:hypothetical protein
MVKYHYYSFTKAMDYDEVPLLPFLHTIITITPINFVRQLEICSLDKMLLLEVLEAYSLFYVDLFFHNGSQML